MKLKLLIYLILLVLFSSCKFKDQNVIALNINAKTSKVFWLDCGTEIVFNDSIVGEYCNDDEKGPIFRLSKEFDQSNPFAFSIVEGPKKFVKTYILLIPLNVKTWEETESIYIGINYSYIKTSSNQLGMSIFYPQMHENEIPNESLKMSIKQDSLKWLNDILYHYKIFNDTIKKPLNTRKNLM